MRPHGTHPPDLVVRRHRPGEEHALWEVFQSAVRGLAARHYGPEQIAAWAPPTYPGAEWVNRIATNQPWVVASGHEPVAFGDLQPDGLIDQFFVAADVAGQGVGRLLLEHLLRVGLARGIGEFHAHVSLAAEGFFAHFGFTVEARQTVHVRGASLSNALMRCRVSDGRVAVQDKPRASGSAVQ